MQHPAVADAVIPDIEVISRGCGGNAVHAQDFRGKFSSVGTVRPEQHPVPLPGLKGALQLKDVPGPPQHTPRTQLLFRIEIIIIVTHVSGLSSGGLAVRDKHPQVVLYCFKLISQCSIARSLSSSLRKSMIRVLFPSSVQRTFRNE